MPTTVMRSDTTAFHNRHEELTERLYRAPDMLPARYVFVLTSRCNLRCPFCFQSKRPDAGGSMNDRDWLALAEQLPEYARVTFTGGEPLVFPAFKRVFSFVAERFDCNLITNGILLTEEIVDFLLAHAHFRVLSISVDNIGNTVRGVKPEQWARVEKIMRYFAQRRDRLASSAILDVKTTVLDENATELLNIHRYCMKNLLCDHHGFQFLKGSPMQHADEMHSFEEIDVPCRALVYADFAAIREQLLMVRRYNIEHGRKAFLHPGAASLTEEGPFDIGWLNEPFHAPSFFVACKYPWSSVHINSDGHLFPCLSVPMGNVRRQPLPEIIGSQAFRHFRDRIRKQGTVAACNRCGWLKRRHEKNGS